MLNPKDDIGFLLIKGEKIMKRRPEGSMSIEKALVGYFNFKSAEGLSEKTLESYDLILKRWIKCIGNIDVNEVSKLDITSHLSYLRNKYIPDRITGNRNKLSPKTIRNVWITLSSFFTWASNEFEITNPMIGIPAPKYTKKVIVPFDKENIESLLKACKFTRVANTKIRKKYVMFRFTALRDRAIILFLLDTGLRSSEFCSLRIKDVDIRIGRVLVRHGQEGGAKGGMGRQVFIGKACRHAVWRYLAEREDGENIDAPLFAGKSERKYTPDALRHLVKRIAEKANIENAYPHRFRHTFAITFLRSGGDVFTLQALLGHNSLDMVRHYSQIACIDIEKAHQKASPVDNWKL